MAILPQVPDHVLSRIIGQGSYGDVWLAENVMGTPRAVKVVYRARFESQRPFEREFAGIQRYEPISRTSEGLVQILHIGRNQAEGYFYYVMELADAAPGTEIGDGTYEPRTLRAELKRQHQLPIEECIEIALSLSAGIAHLHREGLVHRDIKPANIIFVRRQPKLADVGLVGEIAEARSYVGTEGFIPPEGPGAPQADIFALGKVLYEAATGLDREAFPELPDAWLAPDAPAITMEFHEALLRACENDPADRYPTALAMQADLALLRSGQSLLRMRQLQRRVHTLRRVGMTIAAGLLVAIGTFLATARRAKVERANFLRSEALRLRAETAEKSAREQLFSAQLANAAAELRGDREGRRARALSSIRAAARVRPDSADLRSAAASALALYDFSEPREIGNGASTSGLLLPGGGAFAEIENHGNVVIRDVTGRAPARTLSSPVPIAFLWAASADGKKLLASADRYRALVWSLDLDEIVLDKTFPHSTGNFDLLPDGNTLAIAQSDGALMLYPIGSTNGVGGRRLPIGAWSGGYWFSPDGRLVAVANAREPLLSFFAVPEGELIHRLILGAGGSVGNGAWSHDSLRFGAAGSDFKTYIVDFSQPRPRELVLGGHRAEVTEIAVHPVSPLIMTCSWDGTMRLWDTHLGSPVLTLPTWGMHLRWRDPTHLMCATPPATTGSAWVERTLLEPKVCRLLREPIPTAEIAQAKGPWTGAFMANGSLFISASHDGVRFWNPDLGTEAGFLAVGKSVSAWPVQKPQGLFTTGNGRSRRWPMTQEGNEVILDQPEAIPSLSGAIYSAPALGGRRLYVNVGRQTYLYESNIPPRLLCEESGDSIRPFPSPDGSRLALTSREWDDVAIRDGTTGALLARIPAGKNAHAAWSQERLALVWEEGDSIHDLTSYRTLWKRNERAGAALQFSPDQHWLVVATGLHETSVLEPDTGTLVLRLEHPQAEPISSYAFSPDGSRLAVLCTTHVVQLWDLQALHDETQALGLDWRGPRSSGRTVSDPLQVRLPKSF